MSTINASNFGDGTSSVPASVVLNGPKAWGKWTGNAATVALADSYNMSSIVDNGAGDFTLNFSNAMVNADYAGGGYSGIAARAGIIGHDANDALTASAIQLNTHAAGSTTAADAVDCSFAVTGDLA